MLIKNCFSLIKLTVVNLEREKPSASAYVYQNYTGINPGPFWESFSFGISQKLDSWKVFKMMYSLSLLCNIFNFGRQRKALKGVMVYF